MSVIRSIALAAAASVAFTSITLADGARTIGQNGAVDTVMIPQGRGQYIITKLPTPPAEPQGYALTGTSETKPYQPIVVRPGIRGQTMVFPNPTLRW